MALDTVSIERALVTGKWAAAVPDGADDSIAHLAKLVVQGALRDALTSSLAREIFTVDAFDGLDAPYNRLLKFTSQSVVDDREEELLRIVFAAACLHAFVQSNWTGPDLDITPLDVLVLQKDIRPVVTVDHLDAKAISELDLHGEPAYHLMRHPTFLRIAQLLLVPAHHHCSTAAWWRLRTANVHQQVLDEPVPVPPHVFTSLHPLANSFGSDPELSARLLLEKGLLEHRLSQNKSAVDHFTRAAAATGLEYELTGVLGKRTKFQESETSQLVLLAESRLVLESSGDSEATAAAFEDIGNNGGQRVAPVPETLALNDDTLLETTQFTSSNHGAPSSRLAHLNPTSQPALHPLDQCILLALCLNVKNTSPADGLTHEQMTPYIERVISHPRNWSVHTMALLLRARLESTRTRTVERSTLQLQALIDQMGTTDSTLAERLLYFHSVPLPSKWGMEKELAMRLLSLGVVKSALDIFERLEMWEEVVKCWQALERVDKAIAVVRDLLEGRKEESDTVVTRGKASMSQRRQAFDAAREAKLWCLLGDLEPDAAVEHYERAWGVSNETSGRAMRSLGGYYFTRGEYTKAITCLRRAVAINPLLSRSWFVLGCAYSREENWEGGREAFSRCVAIDDDDGESWSNLASMYLRLGEARKVVKEDNEVREHVSPESDVDSSRSVPFSNKLLAFRALKQGLRSRYDNWRMWSNYMIVALDVGELSEACRALSRVVEETSAKLGAESVDADVLDRLVSAVTRVPAAQSTEVTARGADPNEGYGLLPRVLDLFDRVILPRVSSPRVFHAYARLMTWQSRWEDVIKAYLDGYRYGVAGTMGKGETDTPRWRQAVSEVMETADVLRNYGPRVDGYKWRLQGRSIMRTFMARTKEFEDEPEWEQLTALQGEFA